MARRCKYRSKFMLTRKCRTCRHRAVCLKKVRKNRKRANIAIVATLALAVIGIIILCINIFQKQKVESMTIMEVSWEAVQVASKPEETFPDIQIVRKEQKEVQTTAQPVVEVAEENIVTFSESEKIAMGKTVYKEARGECEKGRIAIVAVILNRLETGSAEYGAENGDIMEVITYPNAFAYPRDMTDEFFLNCPEYEICMKAVEAAINGEDPTEAYFPGGARHFYSLVEPLSEEAKANREGIDIYVIGNQAFHNDMN